LIVEARAAIAFQVLTRIASDDRAAQAVRV
jgi:hypothetical protein